MRKFKVGDRVRCIRGFEQSGYTPHTGWTGTVYKVDEDGVAAEWDQVGRRVDFWNDCILDVDLELITDESNDIDARIAAIDARIADNKRRMDECFALMEAAIEKLRASINVKPKEERRATDADMRPGLKVRTPDGWIGVVVMKDNYEGKRYRVTEGWGKRWEIGDANDFTIVEE